MSTKKQPATLVEAIRYFADLDVATEFVAALRWPDGPVCPECGGKEHSYLTTRRLWKCKACKRQFSVKVGTIFEDSPIPLDKWIASVWMIANAKNGISSHELGRAVGLTQKSAWFVLHRVRLAMQRGDWRRFSGEVEVDETFVGGKARNMHPRTRERKITGTGGKDKTAVFGMIERKGEVRAMVVPDTASEPFSSVSATRSSRVPLFTRTRTLPTPGSRMPTTTTPWITPSSTFGARFTRTRWRTSGRC